MLKYAVGLCLACFTILLTFVVLTQKFRMKTAIIEASNAQSLHLFDLTAKLLLGIPVLLDNVVQFTHFRKGFQPNLREYLHNVKGDSDCDDRNKWESRRRGK